LTIFSAFRNLKSGNSKKISALARAFKSKSWQRRFFQMSALFGGSRSLAPSFSGLVASVVSAWLSSAPGARLAVGCAPGADAAVVSSCPPAALSLFAVAPGPSSAASWVSAAAARGASVVWSAGGSPAVPFRARLLRRSLAALAGCSCAVFFLASPASPGSLRVAAAAAARGLPVFAFCCGFSEPPALLVGCSGSWSPSSFCGFPCLAWRPAAAQPRLF
jgi:hypothetical protein